MLNLMMMENPFLRCFLPQCKSFSAIIIHIVFIVAINFINLCRSFHLPPLVIILEGNLVPLNIFSLMDSTRTPESVALASFPLPTFKSCRFEISGVASFDPCRAEKSLNDELISVVDMRSV